MWIMLNNRPFDLSKMDGVSGVIRVTPKLIKDDLGKENAQLNIFNSFDESKRTKIYDSIKTKNFDETLGYFFFLKERIFIQRYLNSASNGICQRQSFILSKIYESEEAAQTALEHFLFEINGILSNLPKINI